MIKGEASLMHTNHRFGVISLRFHHIGSRCNGNITALTIYLSGSRGMHCTRALLALSASALAKFSSTTSLNCISLFDCPYIAASCQLRVSRAATYGFSFKWGHCDKYDLKHTCLEPTICCETLLGGPLYQDPHCVHNLKSRWRVMFSLDTSTTVAGTSQHDEHFTQYRTHVTLIQVVPRVQYLVHSGEAPQIYWCVYHP